MRILTVRQPWAWAIIHGGKDIENRITNIAGGYRGPIAIHAGLADFEDDGGYWEVRRAMTSQLNGWPASDAEVWSSDLVSSSDQRFVYGAIIGVVDLIDVHPGWIEGTPCSQWGIRYVEGGGQHHMVLANPRPLTEPIPYTGALGLRDLEVRSLEVVLEINRQIGVSS